MAWRNSTFDLPPGAFVLFFSFRYIFFFSSFWGRSTLVFGFLERSSHFPSEVEFVDSEFLIEEV